MQRVHVTQDFPQPVEEIFAHLSEHKNLEPLFGAKIEKIADGTDSPNGTGSARRMRVGPLPSFVETNTEVVPNELIRYRITEGGMLKNHEGVMRFSRKGEGSHLDYTIDFDGKVPGTGALLKRTLERSVTKALSELAARGAP